MLRRIRKLPQAQQALHLKTQIERLQGYTDGKPNIHKTSVCIRILQAELQIVTTSRLKREKAA
jgi:hypothetical protein